ncbi:MAG: FAD-dependent oxidoreductase, partial [Firmicutes bacterium]|nr:FAD-dependent oxidoreductase [Bacillota bacterium]
RIVFQNMLKQSGLNRYLFEMANIRDQCSWVHAREVEKATDKAFDLVKMAVAKAALLDPLQEISVEVEPSCLVIGGGIAGMTCALNLAQQGYTVHLVEKTKTLGGNGARLYYGLKGEDALSLSRDLLKSVASHPGITVHLGCTVESVEGYVGNFTTRLSSGAVIKHGAAVIATGAKENKPAGFQYGKSRRVFTTLELEEKMAAGDPLIWKAGTIAFIQCAGTRNKEQPYCSRVCCGMTIRLILQIKAQNPDGKILVFYRDMVTYGFLEQFYKEVRDMGVVFIRYPEEQEPVVEEISGPGGSSLLKVTVQDTSLGKELLFHPDVVALGSGIVPAADNKKLSHLFKVPLNEEGFFLEAHLKLRPVDSSSAGIFMCGLSHGPKNIEESIIQAKAAAARAGALLSKKSFTSEAAVAVVKTEKCQACLTCVRLCPFGAPKMVKNRARIEPVICRGCGVCAGECPNKAIYLLGYHDQIADSMLESLLHDSE